MKKYLMSAFALVALIFNANAVTNMRVKTDDGKIIRYDVDNVSKIYYEETTDTFEVSVSGTRGSFSYVDLGLPSGLEWATCNVGATQPTDYGYYFAWGETSPKYDFSYRNYKLSKDSCHTYTRYVLSSDNGTVDNLTTLLGTEDAATLNSVGGWRMPTKEEQRELIDGCDWEWTDNFNGTEVPGRIGTSKYNGNIIFLPAAGYFLDDVYHYGRGCYWSSSLVEDNDELGYNLFFYEDGLNNTVTIEYRYYGLTIRAVR